MSQFDGIEITFAEMPRIPDYLFDYLDVVNREMERLSGGEWIMAGTCEWVNQIGIRCGNPAGHSWGHGNGLLTTPRDEWHLPSPPAPPPQVQATQNGNPPQPPVSTQEDWTLHEGEQACLWQGAHGRCMLRMGHFPSVGHREHIGGSTQLGG